MFASTRGTTRKGEDMFSLFFASARVTNLLHVKAPICFRERHNCASPRETELCPRKGKKGGGNRGSVCFIVLFFFVKKCSSKPINMGSIFKDIDAKNPTAKTVWDLHVWLKR